MEDGKFTERINHCRGLRLYVNMIKSSLNGKLRLAQETEVQLRDAVDRKVW